MRSLLLLAGLGLAASFRSPVPRGRPRSLRRMQVRLRATFSADLLCIWQGEEDLMSLGSSSAAVDAH
eukprot:scaffold7359_cov255-Pinguiococcus_pyrenoidosus.AAC.24